LFFSKQIILIDGGRRWGITAAQISSVVGAFPVPGLISVSQLH
jgi:hypothetical protein